LKLLNYAVLAAAARRGLPEHIRVGADPALKTVAPEDTIAVVGLALAAGGVGLHQATGNGWWEGVASAAIGALLICAAAEAPLARILDLLSAIPRTFAFTGRAHP
jgi:hypothetical protein